MNLVYLTRVILAISILFFTSAHRPKAIPIPVLLDIYRAETDQFLILGNARTELKLNRQTGAWQSWTADGSAGDFLTATPGQPDLDFSINGQYQVARQPAILLRHEYAIDPDRRGATLSVTTGVGATAGSFAYELTQIFRLRPAQKQVERTARLLRLNPGANGDSSREHFDGFRFQVPGVAVGPRQEVQFTMPGPFFTNTFVRPQTPYDSLKIKTITYHSAPDGGLGLLLADNPVKKLTLASFMQTGGEVNYRSATVGNGTTVTLRHDDYRAYYLATGQSVASDTHWLTLTNSPADALATYRQMVTETMPIDAETPGWVPEQVILEVYPKYFKGGLREITARLPFYKSVGFTMIYLMPHWTGGYSPIDQHDLDPRFGTKADLQNLIKTAHTLGLRVIFDMVIHGFGSASPVPKQHPAMFIKNEGDTLARHPTWKSITPDWASLAYRQYMVDLVLHDQREYGNDGYRVDAASYKGAAWNPTAPYPAYRAGSAAPELMIAMLAALRRKNPQAVLLNEVFGPVFYTVCNFSHDNQTEAVALLLEKLPKGQYTADDYKQHLASVFGALPAGANRVFFARNHDTDWFYTFGGYTPQFMAFEAVHALFGIPEVFAGDPDYPFNPDDRPAIYDHYKRLFAFRRDNPAFVRGTIDLTTILSDNPQIFNGLRILSGQTSVALVSFSGKPETAIITRTDMAAGKPVPILTDVVTGKRVLAQSAGKGAFSVSLQPFQVVAGAW